MTISGDNEHLVSVLQASSEQVRQPAYTKPTGRIYGYIKEHPPKDIGAIT